MATIFLQKAVKSVMSMKRTFKEVLRKAGFDVVRYPPHAQIVNDLRLFFNNYRVNLVLDVGAYHGKYCRILRDEVGFRGQIISFEPSAKSFEVLAREMTGDEKWKGFDFGLSSAGAQAHLNTHGNHGDFNSLLTLQNEHAAAYEVTEHASEVIQLRRLDEVWPALASLVTDPRVFLKMDTQGHDIDVLVGASNCAQVIVGLQSELPAIEIYDGMQSMPEMLKIFGENQFTPIGFYPVNRPNSYEGAIPEFDAIFLRRAR